MSAKRRKARSGAPSLARGGRAFDLRAALAHAVRAFQQGRLEQAERELRAIVARAPANPTCLYNLGYILQRRGRHSEAIARYRQVLAIDPEHVDARFNLANALHAQSELDSAEAAYRELLQRRPDHAGAHNNLGNLLDAAGRGDEAEAAYRRALEIDPAYVQALLNLGNFLARRGCLDEAEERLRAALRVEPGSAPLHTALASTLVAQGRDADAVVALRTALEHDPDAVEAIVALAALLRSVGRLDEALALCTTAVARLPAVAELHNALGVALYRAGRVQDAERALREAVRLDPGYAEAFSNLGLTLTDQERVGEAEDAQRRALALDPGLAGAYNNLGVTLAAQGRREEAEQAYRQALRCQPDMAGVYANLVNNAGSGAVDDADVGRMRKLLEGGELSPDDAAALCFALGEIHDRRQRYEAAFDYYRRGNEIRRAAARFDARAFSEYVGRLLDTFDEALFASRVGWGAASTSPVFIVGMPRSGTTLIEQILASHPQVHGAGEISKVNAMVHGLEADHGGAGAYPGCVPGLAAGALRELGEAYLAFSRQGLPESVSRVTDKQLTNLEHLGLIALMLPQAKVVYCRRDPLDTCLSNYFHDFQRGMDYAYDLREIGVFYRHYQRLAEHWRHALPLPIHEVVYEDVVADTERQARALIDYLELPWDDACLAFERSRRVVRTASMWQVREPVYRRALARWRHYERHLQPLREALGAP